jgi:GxxExxY protein
VSYNIHYNVRKIGNGGYTVKKDPLTDKVIGCAIEVHKALGPGLLESAYQHALAHELQLNGIVFKMEVNLPVEYKDVHVDCGYRMDFVVENRLILELKSLNEMKAIHTAQMLTYMKVSGIRTGLLINFNVQLLVFGIKRLII